jgi:glutathione synthase
VQVELNTIAASFACLSTITTQLHQHILGRLRGTAAAAAAAATKSSASTGTSGLSEAAAAAAGLLSGHRLPSNAAMQVRLGQSWCWRL